jgi:hypothetical protein
MQLCSYVSSAVCYCYYVFMFYLPNDVKKQKTRAHRHTGTQAHRHTGIQAYGYTGRPPLIAKGRISLRKFSLPHPGHGNALFSMDRMVACFMEMPYRGKAWKNPGKASGFSHTLPQYLEKSRKEFDFSTFPQNL